MWHLGVDEVGRGALAGPIMAAAVLVDSEQPGDFLHVMDSKKLSPGKRVRAFRSILRSNHLRGLGVSLIDVDFINNHGIQLANVGVLTGAVEEALLDMRNANKSFRCTVWVDGILRLSKEHDLYQLGVCDIKYLPQADSKIPAVSAASIIAKVLRDRHMEELAIDYPGYDFENSSGYGSPKHMAAITSNGINAAHRKLFVRKITKS